MGHMELKFLGVGDAFASSEHFNTSAILTENTGEHMLIDCGISTPIALEEAGYKPEDLDAVYISHLHADHVGALEWLGFYTAFVAKKKIKLFIHEDLIKDLWDSLKISMQYTSNQVNSLDTFFDVNVISTHKPFKWGDSFFIIAKQLHINNYMQNIYSYGLFGKARDYIFYYTSDTLFNPCNNIKDAFMYMKADIIFHDCETVNSSPVHAHYDELIHLPDNLKRKMWLMHYQDPDIIALPDAKSDGFAGFVKKHQKFKLAREE